MARFAWFRIACLCSFVVLTACGGSGGKGGKDPDQDGSDGDTSGDADNGDGDSDGGEGDGEPADGGEGDGDDDGDAGGPPGDGGSCKTSCEADDCGEFVSDNCGGHLSCPTACPANQICGVLRPDKCDFPPPVECTPKQPSEVCAGKCGAVEDGCSDVVTCNASNGGVTCGANQYCENSQCVEIVSSCTPLAESDACENKCGVVSDGCSDVFICSSANGGVSCGEGKKCDETAGSGTRNSCVDLPPPSCTAKLAAEACAGTCGIVDDGCGEQIDCEVAGFGCSGGESCGGGGVPGECGAGTVCTPIDVSVACAGRCGFVSDGCSSGYTCTDANGGETCDPNAGESCGGGGVSGQCGKPACVALTANQACPGSGGNKSCGNVSNGCGGLIDCGGCPTAQACGLQQANVCGDIPTCQPTPIGTACSGKCGTVPDGCGGTYTCNGTNGGVTCSGGEYCGATQPNTCGAPPVTCTPKTCAQLGHSCGLASDGCGHVINCWPGCSPTNPNCAGSCGDAASCLSNATTGAQSCVSGSPACSGALCGSVPNNCAANAPTRLTGTVRTPGRLENGSYINRLPVPNALVYIPADPAPALPSIFQGVDPANSASCGRCEDEQLVADGQSVLAAAVTDYKGEFTLEGRIPVGTAFELVVKVGKWRRVVQVPSGIAAACQSRALAVDYTRLPASSTDGLGGTHLPKIAVSTGDVDEMECVFRNMGFAESEFTAPSGSGRVHLYRANGARVRGTVQVCNGTYVSGGGNTRNCSRNSNEGCRNNYAGCSWGTSQADVSVADSTLVASQASLNAYDMVVFDCEGDELWESDDEEARVEAYVNAGGRLFASHFSYIWLENNGTLDQSADWGMSGTADTGTGYVSMPSGTTSRSRANSVKSPLFRDWLDWQGALTGTSAGVLNNPATPQFTIDDPRDRAGANVGVATDEWVYRNLSAVCSNDASRTCTTNAGCQNGGTCGVPRPRVQQLSFNTPYGASEANICGRVAYSGFHVAAADNNGDNDFFPDVCSNGELSAQEKILAFMLFDLATCVSEGDPPQPPSCTPKTAAQVCPGENDACGYVSDGCGGVVDCGGCSSGFYCDGNTCKPQECTPSTCASLGFNCGEHADGCGGIARNNQGTEGCGTCSDSQLCGLGGPGVCGTVTCTPIPVGNACPPNSCGLVSNGCGGTWNCGTCPTGVCGGGGPNQCGSSSCTVIPKATACAGKNCGLVSDGCGGSYDCGTCTPPDTCGGGGNANVCGHPVCDAYTEDEACEGLDCGWVSDGCGGAINCGTCPNGGVCGGNGPNLCGGACSPTTCAAEGAECGAISDECGSVLNCGSCPSGQTCGADGPNQCGSGPSCTPRSCETVGAECGLVGDGCGKVLDCGDCTVPGETCGGAGQANQCGPGSGGCNPLSCEGQAVECGAASNGCGGLLDCGGCPQGYKCERGDCKALPPIIF